MFNLSGSELIFLVVIALVVLGPDKLPEAMRKAGKAYADFKKMTTGFQAEMKSVLDEPMRELRETAELAKNSAMFDTKPFTDSLKDLGNTVSKPATKPATKPVSGSMADLTPATPVAVAAGTMAAATARSGSTVDTPAAAAADTAAADTPVVDDAAARRLARATPPSISVSTTQVDYGAHGENATATDGSDRPAPNEAIALWPTEPQSACPTDDEVPA